MEELNKRKIIELLVINGKATKAELEGIDPDFEKVLVELNNETPNTIAGYSNAGKIYYTYTPARAKAAIQILEEKTGEVADPSPAQSSTAPEGSPEREISGSTAEDKTPFSLPVIDPPADAPGVQRKPDEPALPDPGDGQITAYRVLVKNFRLTTSGGRTKITAIPYDNAQAQVALEFCQAGPTKGDDPVFIDVWRPDPASIKTILASEVKTAQPRPESPDSEAEGSLGIPEHGNQEEVPESSKKAPVVVEGKPVADEGPPVADDKIVDLEEKVGKSVAQIREEIQKQGLSASAIAASEGMMKEEPIE